MRARGGGGVETVNALNWPAARCQIHSRVERASFLEFVEGTRKAFAAAKASLLTSLSFATRPGREGTQGALNSFGRSQSISQLLNKEDSFS